METQSGEITIVSLVQELLDKETISTYFIPSFPFFFPPSPIIITITFALNNHIFPDLILLLPNRRLPLLVHLVHFIIFLPFR